VFGFESWIQVVVALVAAIAAGAANTIAGGGTILSFPVLVWIGLPPVVANATSTVGLWTGSAGGAWSYRGRLRTLEGRWVWLVLPALTGGALGAWLLVNLPARWFGSIAPLMVIAASALVAVEPLIRRKIAFHSDTEEGGRALRVAGILIISGYGGYFGAGLGILVLVALALLGIENLHEANALKNLLVLGIKGAAVAYFIVLGVLDWPIALLMIIGSTFGGWGGGFLVREVEPTTLRWLIVVIGLAMGLIMIVRTYF
jgi:uncharacterized protein